MRTELRPDLIVWEPDTPDSRERRWKAWQEAKNEWGGGWRGVPGSVRHFAHRPENSEILALPKRKGHRWVVGPI